MQRTLTFKVRLNQEERQLLFAVAASLNRSCGDTLRFLVRSAAEERRIFVKDTVHGIESQKGGTTTD
jgi:hypothetical protein